MFINVPIHVTAHVRSLALLLNTALLIAGLVVFEVVYSEQSKERRQYLIYFIPLAVVLVGLLIYAVFLQGSK